MVQASRSPVRNRRPTQLPILSAAQLPSQTILNSLPMGVSIKTSPWIMRFYRLLWDLALYFIKLFDVNLRYLAIIAKRIKIFCTCKIARQHFQIFVKITTWSKWALQPAMRVWSCFSQRLLLTHGCSCPRHSSILPNRLHSRDSPSHSPKKCLHEMSTSGQPFNIFQLIEQSYLSHSLERIF